MPNNFKYIVNVNGAHESVGRQPNVGADMNIPLILIASGFKGVIEASTPEEIKIGMEEVQKNERFALVVHTHQGARSDLKRPTTTPQENKTAMMEKIVAMTKRKEI